ncbi:MAG TPA: dTMP kinase [Spirochaetia bacterium]|nr:dTMP kinase [Spirochaetia bacterium]
MNSRHMVLNNFLVLEGLDGSGTTTQAHLLAERCSAEGIACWTTSEPTNEAIGTLIRHFLKGDEPVHPDTMALLFAADRSEHLHRAGSGIEARAAAGELVVSDRYLFSSLVYQTVACDPEFVAAVNSQFPLPATLVYLDVPVEVCIKRLADRSHREIYEAVEFLERVRDRYEEILPGFEGSDMEIVRLDGTGSPAEISDSIWKTVAGRPITGV